MVTVVVWFKCSSSLSSHCACSICVQCSRRRTFLQTMIQPAVHGLARGRGRPRACPLQHAQAICTSQQSVLGACSIHTYLQTSLFPCRMTSICPPWVQAQLGGRAQSSLGDLPTPSTQLSAEVILRGKLRKFWDFPLDLEPI